jgi:hypothetical protein
MEKMAQNARVFGRLSGAKKAPRISDTERARILETVTQSTDGFLDKVLRINRRTNNGQRGPGCQRNPVDEVNGDA